MATQSDQSNSERIAMLESALAQAKVEVDRWPKLSATWPVPIEDGTFMLDDGETTIAADKLTAGQLDGTACIWCDRHDGHMMPVGHGPRGQVFEHTPDCPERTDEEYDESDGHA
jgi:hypothetical protein